MVNPDGRVFTERLGIVSAHEEIADHREHPRSRRQEHRAAARRRCLRRKAHPRRPASRRKPRRRRACRPVASAASRSPSESSTRGASPSRISWSAAPSPWSSRPPSSTPSRDARTSSSAAARAPGRPRFSTFWPTSFPTMIASSSSRTPPRSTSGRPNLVRFEARREQPGLPAVAIRDLLKASLRHRPDRIIVGEIRGGEAFDLAERLEHRPLGKHLHRPCELPRAVRSRASRTSPFRAASSFPTEPSRPISPTRSISSFTSTGSTESAS